MQASYTSARCKFKKTTNSKTIYCSFFCLCYIIYLWMQNLFFADLQGLFRNLFLLFFWGNSFGVIRWLFFKHHFNFYSSATIYLLFKFQKPSSLFDCFKLLLLIDTRCSYCHTVKSFDTQNLMCLQHKILDSNIIWLENCAY